MKICLIAPVSRWRGGIHQYSVHLANQLAKNNEVHAISYRSLFPRWFYPGKIKTTLGELSVSAGITVHELLKYHSLVSSFRAANLIEHSIRPDVVDIQWFVPQHGFILIPLMLFLKFWFRSTTRIFVTVHNISPHERRFLDRSLSRLAFRLSDRLLVHAERLREEAVKRFCQDPKKIAVIPHGICSDGDISYGKADARARLGIKEKYVLLFFGYVRPYKGLDDLIQAFKIITEKFDAALLVAGEFFTKIADCREELKNSGVLEKTYLFPRYVDAEEVPIFFAAADLLIQPYKKFSGQSGVTQTAYLHSVPVIATDVGGLPELVIHGESGIIVRPNDPQALASAMESLLSDEVKRHCYGRAGKNVLEAQLTWDRVSERLLKIYAAS
jgi:glycosyltransferase involved in cell wall biosynthesis